MSITTFAEKSTLLRLRLFSSCNPCYNLQRTRRCLTHNKRHLGDASFNISHRSHSRQSYPLLSSSHQHTWKTTQLRPRYSFTNYMLNRSISSYDNNNNNNQDESTFDQYYDNTASTLFTTNDGDFYDHDVQTNENHFNKRNNTS